NGPFAVTPPFGRRPPSPPRPPTDGLRTAKPPPPARGPELAPQADGSRARGAGGGNFVPPRPTRRRWYMVPSLPHCAPRRTPARRPLCLAPLEDRCLLSGDVVLEWNAIALDALKNDSFLGANARQAGPTRASRALAIVQAAVFDAVNSIDRSYEPYLIQIN